MPLEAIYVVRHGFRSSWTVNHVTGSYSASIPSPTGIAVDPALTAHGVDQAKQLGHHLMTLDPPIDAMYSSPYYRCLQTIGPFIELQHQRQGSRSPVGVVGGANARDAPAAVTIRPEHGLCEWFGAAPFEHPGPASPSVLKSMFPAYDEAYVSAQCPPRRGETLAQLQARLTATLQSIVDRCDAENRRAAVLSTHAAVVIMLGRILTGSIPQSVDTEDFRAFTCGLSVYRRRDLDKNGKQGNRDLGVGHSAASPVVGSWACAANSDCSFLSCGEERGWNFTGEEEFPGTGSMGQDTSKHKL